MMLPSLFKKMVESNQTTDIQNFVTASFEQFYERLRLFVYSKNKSYTEDIIQDTFEKFQKRIQEILQKELEMDFQSDEEVLRYLIVIARNTCYNHFNTKTHFPLDENWDSSQQTINPSESFDFNEEIEATLHILSERQQVLFRLKVAGYRYEEIAEHQGMTVAAVRKSIYRGRKKLKALGRNARFKGS